MRFNAIFPVLATSLVSASALVARSPSDYPSCSLPCLTNADTSICSPTDNACLCTNNSYLRSTTDCIQSSCSPEDLDAAAVIARKICSVAGVDIMTNPAAQPTSASASAAPTGATSSNAAPTSPILNKIVLMSGFAVVAAVLKL
ncbi:hypothetical protein M407DRAFT_216884 [Tulasnella calospora MUT 4182]|uniref:CFEM domain-containing protein n=1 Tax=Tulasnella calospora MUT 4182 TaxID=1051891 RepID=A0A0C3KL50_9AGAM|nr:hypothetical protein M407DRAFT_216884 [Tulasnella calospora MUT 4182]